MCWVVQLKVVCDRTPPQTDLLLLSLQSSESVQHTSIPAPLHLSLTSISATLLNISLKSSVWSGTGCSCTLLCGWQPVTCFLDRSCLSHLPQAHLWGILNPSWSRLHPPCSILHIHMMVQSQTVCWIPGLCVSQLVLTAFLPIFLFFLLLSLAFSSSSSFSSSFLLLLLLLFSILPSLQQS